MRLDVDLTNDEASVLREWGESLPLLNLAVEVMNLFVMGEEPDDGTLNTLSSLMEPVCWDLEFGRIRPWDSIEEKRAMRDRFDSIRSLVYKLYSTDTER